MVVASTTNSFSKEMTIRRRISSVFNKREEDFPSLKEYNDYLEEVEDMTFSLIEGIDVSVIETKISRYEEENAEQIMVARARKAEEYAAALASSKGHPIQTDDDMAPSQRPQAGYGVSGQGHYAPAIAGGALAQPQPTPLKGGPDIHGYPFEDEEMTILRAQRGGRAGGWNTEFGKKRSLEEAFCCIWV